MDRNIARTIHAPLVSMGNIQLRQPIPVADLQQISPFILLHHFDFVMQAGHNNFDVPPHPHRGFMPITFMYEGAVAHEDSLGNAQVISDNEVQWINAGSGIIHSEKAGKAFVAKGGRFQGIQLWINLPAAEKMSAPSYQPITKDEMVLIEKEGVQIRLISGKYGDKTGPARAEVFTAMMHMKAGADHHFSFPTTNHVVFYILEGEVSLNETQQAQRHQLILFEKADGEILIRASSDAKLLLLAGNPIDEPLVTHGPFVMNSQTEILEAMRDYQQGRMGVLY